MSAFWPEKPWYLASLIKIILFPVTCRYGDNPNLCANADSCQTQTPEGKRSKSNLAIFIGVPVALVAVIISVAVVAFCFLRQKKRGYTSLTNFSILVPGDKTNVCCTWHSGSARNSVKPQNETTSSLQLENRRFTYSELETTTNNFQRVLGRGGFGYVYHGIMEDGTQVAVKLRSESSNQGVREFLAEVYHSFRFASLFSRTRRRDVASVCSNEI